MNLQWVFSGSTLKANDLCLLRCHMWQQGQEIPTVTGCHMAISAISILVRDKLDISKYISYLK